MKTNKIKLLLGCGALIALGAASLQGCSSSDDSSGTTGGTGGASTGGTSAGGKGGSGTAGAAGKTGTGGSGTGGSGTAGSLGTAGTSTGGAEGGATGSEGGEAGEGGEPGAAGAPSAAEHPSADECTKFCNLDAATCTAGNAAYASTSECQTDCVGYALGDDSDPTRLIAKTGNNFACRAYHLQNAINNMATPSLLTLHCGHTALVSSACN
jgi:hypothetical protein